MGISYQYPVSHYRTESMHDQAQSLWSEMPQKEIFLYQIQLSVHKIQVAHATPDQTLSGVTLLLLSLLRQHPAHVVPYTVVGQKTLNRANRRDGNVAVPKLPLGEIHDILLRDGANNALNLLGC